MVNHLEDTMKEFVRKSSFIISKFSLDFEFQLVIYIPAIYCLRI